MIAEVSRQIMQLTILFTVHSKDSLAWMFGYQTFLSRLKSYNQNLILRALTFI